MIRCTACDHPDVGLIDAALRSGTSTRAVARDYRVGRGVLARHAVHIQAIPATGKVVSQLDESLHQLERASTPRERLRGLESVRSALSLELRDHRRARSGMREPDEAEMAKLAANVDDAWAEYEAVAGGGVDLALRALQGVREALGQLRAAEARAAEGVVPMTVATAEGTRVATLTVDPDVARRAYGVPERYWNADHKIVVQTFFRGLPDIRAYDSSSRMVWRRPAAPEPVEEEDE